MSTNPFRRSSLKDYGGSTGAGEGIPVTSFPIDIPNSGTDTPTSLVVNTKGTASSQKHVNFASPPAIPISPVSYPPSPESSRTSPIYTFAGPVLPSPTNYSTALQSDPFHAEAVTDDNDSAIAQALENAKANTVLAAPSLEASRQDAVRNTLSKFASVPKRPPVVARDATTQQASAPHRQTMDVDAFKRLLLTGDSGDGQKHDGFGSASSVTIPPIANDNSSATDSASISQRSVFDQGLAADDSPRSSNELDHLEAESIRRSLAPSGNIEGKKKPPPPAPRHGKPISKTSITEAPSHPTPLQAIPATNSAKKPPAPPLARRSSQNSDVLRPRSSRQSSSSEVDQSDKAHDGGHRPAPPPPRPRRPVGTTERRQSTDLPTTMEESDSTESITTPSRKSSDSRPPPPPSRNSGKRQSMGTMNPPPLPPPRRGRASSRSSTDSQRPPLVDLLVAHTSEPINGELPSLETGRQKESSNSATNHLLADLAALQQEVEEARRKASK